MHIYIYIYISIYLYISIYIYRERQAIRQGQRSSRPNTFLTPTATARPDQAAIASAAEAPGTTHRARPRSPFSLYIYGLRRAATPHLAR